VQDVASPQAVRLAELLAGPAVTATSEEPGLLEVSGVASERIGEMAAANGIVLHELTRAEASLEEAFMEPTRDDVEFRAEVAA
jgi:ABC-2 type transport system ATP-binding protein